MFNILFHLITNNTQPKTIKSNYTNVFVISIGAAHTHTVFSNLWHRYVREGPLIPTHKINQGYKWPANCSIGGGTHQHIWHGGHHLSKLHSIVIWQIIPLKKNRWIAINILIALATWYTLCNQTGTRFPVSHNLRTNTHIHHLEYFANKAKCFLGAYILCTK